MSDYDNWKTTEPDDILPRADLDGTDIPDEHVEPHDSCEECGVNIYEHQDGGERLCDQCEFYRNASKVVDLFDALKNRRTP